MNFVAEPMHCFDKRLRLSLRPPFLSPAMIGFEVSLRHIEAVHERLSFGSNFIDRIGYLLRFERVLPVGSRFLRQFGTAVA